MNAMPFDTERRNRPRRGLTLLELLVVVLILAILTTVAVQSVEPMVQQARFDATKKALDEVQASLAGAPATATSDGQLSFFDDLGRPPALLEVEPGYFQPSELWLKPDLVAAYTVKSSADGNVSLGGGWRGPYLRLPVGQTMLLDGWGNKLQMESANVSGVDVLRLFSLGSDGLTGTTTSDAFAQDLAVEIPVSLTNGTAGGHVHPPIDGTVSIKLYYFDPSQANLAEATLATSPTTANGYQFSFSGVNPYGRKAIWVETNSKSRVFYFTRLQSDLELRFFAQ